MSTTPMYGGSTQNNNMRRARQGGVPHGRKRKRLEGAEERRWRDREGGPQLLLSRVEPLGWRQALPPKALAVQEVIDGEGGWGITTAG